MVVEPARGCGVSPDARSSFPTIGSRERLEHVRRRLQSFDGQTPPSVRFLSPKAAPNTVAGRPKVKNRAFGGASMHA